MRVGDRWNRIISKRMFGSNKLLDLTSKLSEGFIHFLGGSPIIQTEGYELDAANSVDRQIPKIYVDVTTIYIRVEPWKERGSPNIGRVSRKIYVSAKRRRWNPNPSTVNPIVLPIRIVGGNDSQGYGKSHFVVSMLQGKAAQRQRTNWGENATRGVGINEQRGSRKWRRTGGRTERSTG